MKTKLNRIVQSPNLEKFENFQKRNPFYASLGIVTFSLISMLSMNSMVAQEATPTVKSLAGTLEQQANAVSVNSKKNITVKGLVKDEKDVLAGASVSLKGTLIGVNTDINGKFTFPKTLKVGDILVFSFLGYETVEVKIKADTTFVTVLMKENHRVILGAVETDKVYKSKYTSKKS